MKLLQISITRFFLIGPIPETPGNFVELTELHLYRTTTNWKVPLSCPFYRSPSNFVKWFFFFTGETPCVNLKVLQLQSNKLTGNCMIRPTILPQISQSHFFDRSLGNCTELDCLSFSSNQLEGKLYDPCEILPRFCKSHFLQERPLNHLETVPSWRIFNSTETN
jgi:hypothetical protein